MSWARRGIVMPRSFSAARQNVLLVYRRDIVEAVEIRDRLQIGFVLDQLSVPR
jgi:hypothetical protein